MRTNNFVNLSEERLSSLQGFESRRTNARLFKFSVLTTGVLFFGIGLLEACLISGPKLLPTLHIVGGLICLVISYFASELIRFEAMVAFTVCSGVPFVVAGMLYSNGLGGSSPVWFATFPIYALVFSGNSKLRIAYMVYSFCGIALALFCEIYWANYFTPFHEQYPIVLSWVVTLLGFVSTGTHIFLYESKRNRMNRIISRQQRWLDNSRRLTMAGTLAGSIAHEINTPIATIQMLAQSTVEKLTTESNNDHVLENMTTIVRVVEHINKTVRSLLNFSRRKGGEEFTTQDLQALLDEVAVLTRMRFQRHGIEFSILPENLEGLKLVCRPYEVSQALLVLINNSVDAIAKLNERWIELRIRGSDGSCEMELTDSGLGIPPEIARNIFDPYFTTKAEGEGTGLGLSVALQFIKDHGGTLSYLSGRVNTTFRMTIPARKEAE